MQRGKKIIREGKREGREGERKGRKGRTPAPEINFWLSVVNKSYPVRRNFKRGKA